MYSNRPVYEACTVQVQSIFQSGLVHILTGRENLIAFAGTRYTSMYCTVQSCTVYLLYCTVLYDSNHGVSCELTALENIPGDPAYHIKAKTLKNVTRTPQEHTLYSRTSRAVCP